MKHKNHATGMLNKKRKETRVNVLEKLKATIESCHETDFMHGSVEPSEARRTHSSYRVT